MYHKTIRHFFLFQCFLLSSSYAVNPHADLIHKPSGSVQEENTQNADTNHKAQDFFGSGKLQSNRLYAEGGAIYGYISDGGTSGVSVAETFTPTGQYNNDIFRPAPNFGFNVRMGYKFDDEGTKAAYAEFTMLTNHSPYDFYAENGSFLINDISELGDFQFSGFAAFNGPAQAHDYVQLRYMGATIALRRPWEEPNFKIFRFSKIVGLKYARITKKFTGNVSGNVFRNITNNDFATTPGQDFINYNAELNAIGPIVGVDGVFFVNDQLKLKGYGYGALMAGLAQSQITENAYSEETVRVGIGKITQVSTSFVSSQVHRPQAWTPAFLEIGTSVIYDLFHNPNFSIEGGITAAYILPTLSNGSYSQAIGGQGLVRLNDNLNMSMAFLRLNANYD